MQDTYSRCYWGATLLSKVEETSDTGLVCIWKFLIYSLLPSLGDPCMIGSTSLYLVHRSCRCQSQWYWACLSLQRLATDSCRSLPIHPVRLVPQSLHLSVTICIYLKTGSILGKILIIKGKPLLFLYHESDALCPARTTQKNWFYHNGLPLGN